MSTRSAHRPASLAAAVASAGALLLALAAGAWAQGPPLAGSGSGVITSVQVTSSRDAGGNRIEERRLEGVLSGTLEGQFVEEVRGVVHRDGQVNFHGTLVFTGTVAECGEGVVHARLSGKGTAGQAPQTEATFSVVDQPSNTVAATGGGEVVQDGPFLDYQIQYVCR